MAMKSTTQTRRHETTERGRPSSSRGIQGRPEKSTVNPLSQCIEVCNETLSYCLEQGEDHADREHILGLIDCIDSCWFVVGLQSRDSELVPQAMEVCAEACKRCEDSCGHFEDDETMDRCAEACREAYEYCNR